MFDTSGTFYGTPGTYPWRAKLIAPRADPLCDAEKVLEKNAKKEEQLAPLNFFKAPVAAESRRRSLDDRLPRDP